MQPSQISTVSNTDPCPKSSPCLTDDWFIHVQERNENKLAWENKPRLREEYGRLFEEIRKELAQSEDFGGTLSSESIISLELGSGMGNIKQWIPEMVTSERDPSPDVDRIESAYEINYPDGALSNIVAMDVWHHLACPEQALDEWHRALQHGGRVVLMEPGMSLLGFLIFGLIHHEPVGWFTKFLPKSKWSADDETYFAAQSSAHRHFVRKQFPELLQGWTVKTKRLPALAYLTTGGFSKPQIGPNWFAKLFRMLETPASFFPWIFSTRLLVVLEKISDKPKQPSFLR